MTLVGEKACVSVIVNSPKDCLVKAIHELYQSWLIKYNGVPRNWERLMHKAPERKYDERASALEAIEGCGVCEGTSSGLDAAEARLKPAPAY